MNMKLYIYILAILTPFLVQAKDSVYTVTAYCPCTICTGLYSGGPTASGQMPKQGVTIAAPRSIPFGKILEIEGVGRRVVQDRLAQAYDKRIDIFVRSHRIAKRFGIRKLRVTEAEER
jgi:3D (Asp-Asp-Asp) domain-containing protein